MWTATLIEINRESLNAVVLFTDNVSFKITENFDLKDQTSASFRNRIEARRKQLEDTHNFIDNLNIQTFNLTPDAEIPPTKEELDKKGFFEKYAKWRGMKIAVEQGLLASDDKTYTDLTAEVKAAYKPEYGVL